MVENHFCDNFWRLNRSQQLRQLAAFTRIALERYALGPTKIEPLHYGMNAIYRVTQLSNGTRFVLRIHAPQTAKAYVRSELIWLDALQADGFTVPRAIPAGEDRVIIASVPGIPEERVCTLFSWIEGRVSRKHRTAEQARRIGRQIARLHRHAADLGVPRGFTRALWDADFLLADSRLNVGWRRLNSPQFRLMREVADRLQSVASRLGRGNEVLGVIHGDHTFDNVLFHRGEARIIDFDDCCRGYFLYDLATLLDRMEWREDYADLRAALLLGYRQERSLCSEHESLLDLFLLVRWTFLGLAFLTAPDSSPSRAYSGRFLKTVIPKMRKYLGTI